MVIIMKHKLRGSRSFLLALFGLLLSPGLTPSANAVTIIKVPLSESGFDLAFDGSTLATLSDGNDASTGDQDTNVVFSAVLNFMADVTDSSASFSLGGITADGLPVETSGVVVQTTSNGTFSLWDGSNTLLISGSLASGAITGSTTSSTGSYFNTTFATFTGGTLAALLDPNSSALSLALSAIVSNGQAGLRFNEDGTLAAFSADGSGLIEGSAAVPEPMSLMLLLAGLTGGAAARKRRA